MQVEATSSAGLVGVGVVVVVIVICYAARRNSPRMSPVMHTERIQCMVCNKYTRVKYPDGAEIQTPVMCDHGGGTDQAPVQIRVISHGQGLVGTSPPMDF